MTARDHRIDAPSTEPAFERVASLGDLPIGALLGVTLSSGAAVCLFNAAGRIGAIADLCTHQAFPMSQGTLLTDGTVQCSWHGAKFDSTTGEVREGPAADPIRVYQTMIRDGWIWVGAAR